jgi:hypothetical protein
VGTRKYTKILILQKLRGSNYTNNSQNQYKTETKTCVLDVLIRISTVPYLFKEHLTALSVLQGTYRGVLDYIMND